jgi:hypothetical protein
MNDQHLVGHPVQLLTIDENEKFVFNKEGIEELLLNGNIEDHTAVVVSIAGDFRTGKSFLLDFFLRFLDSKVRMVQNYKTYSKIFGSISEYDYRAKIFSSQCFQAKLKRIEKLLFGGNPPSPNSLFIYSNHKIFFR